MAANIFFKFSSLMSMSGTENDKYKFTLYTIYAQVCLHYNCLVSLIINHTPLQGMPLLLCAIVALIEKFGSCDMTRPNMGVAQCFLGNPWGDQWASNNDTRGQWTAFFSSPEFIYFYSVIIALQAANILFFLLTVYYLVEHWRNSAGIIRSETKGNFMIVIKLFFIMGRHNFVGSWFFFTVKTCCCQVFLGLLNSSLILSPTSTGQRTHLNSDFS